MGWFLALVLPCFTMLYHIKNLPNFSFTFLIAPILARYPSLSFNIAIEHHHFLVGKSFVGGRFPSFFCVSLLEGTPHRQPGVPARARHRCNRKIHPCHSSTDELRNRSRDRPVALKRSPRKKLEE